MHTVTCNRPLIRSIHFTEIDRLVGKTLIIHVLLLQAISSKLYKKMFQYRNKVNLIIHNVSGIYWTAMYIAISMHHFDDKVEKEGWSSTKLIIHNLYSASGADSSETTTTTTTTAENLKMLQSIIRSDNKFCSRIIIDVRYTYIFYYCVHISSYKIQARTWHLVNQAY